MRIKNYYTLFFFIFYLLVYFPIGLLLYAWTSFGGWNSMNLIQKSIYYFFNFPIKNSNIDCILFSILINAFFWSLIFNLFIKIYKKII